jgi:hypothetical protein
MSCSVCTETPGAHTFQHTGHWGAIQLYYSNPAKSQVPITTYEQFLGLKPHMDPLRGREWIWIIDCRGLEFKHCPSIGALRKMAQALFKEQYGSLQTFWIIHPNPWIKKVIQLLRPLFPASVDFSQMRFFGGDPLECMQQLEKEGVVGKTLHYLLGIVGNKPLPSYDQWHFGH